MWACAHEGMRACWHVCLLAGFKRAHFGYKGAQVKSYKRAHFSTRVHKSNTER
jgi:hypothetical protein